jgi:hypothetical protein
VYPVTADPPLLEGAVQLTIAEAGPWLTVIALGAVGIVRGVPEYSVDEGLVPIAFVALKIAW